ncbi:MAG: stage 0 sporulation family protein [Coriobacteriia bacterium]|nr:stage 0 sporulation family protein [Coriobacteriia bacterium]
MPAIVGVRLRNAAKPVLLDIDIIEGIAADTIVLVDSERGPELGAVTFDPREALAGDRVDAASRIVRVATADDLRSAEDIHRREREALPVYRRLVNKHKLDMKPTDVEFSFDGTRAVFYFVAEERVDFRDLVRDLASEFHTRVDMRQIGVRDEARMIGGLGHCGEQLCCMRFGGEFQPVSIRMAKEQDLPLNPLKISGLCGRLMCCLRYEYEAYKDFKGRAPKKGAIIEVGEQKGKVVEFNTPKETVTMRLEEGGTMTVPLEDMECCKGEGCPCKVKAEALERRAAAMSASISSIATVSGSPSLTSGTSAPAVAPSATDAAPAERTSRRRRRGGGGGGGEGAAAAPQPVEGGKTGKQGGRSGAKQPRGRQAQRGGQSATSGQASAAPAQPPAPQGEASATPGRRRRRRRSGGSAAGGESA